MWPQLAWSETWPSRPRQQRHKALVSRPRPGPFGGRVTIVHHYPGAPLDVAVDHSAPSPSWRARASLLMLPGTCPRLCLVDTSLDAQSSPTRVLSTGSAAHQTDVSCSSPSGSSSQVLSLVFHPVPIYKENSAPPSGAPTQESSHRKMCRWHERF